MINVTADFTTVEDRSYPYLGYTPYKHQIVLFTSKECGVLISGESNAHKIGEYVEGWYEYKFSSIEGTVTISNK